MTPGARGAKWPPVRAAGIGIPTRRDPEISLWEPVPPGGRILFLSTAPGCSISLALLVSETCARYGRAGRAERCRTPAGLERCWRSGSGSGSGSGGPFRAAPRTHGSGRVRAGQRFPGWVGAALGRAKAAVGRPVGSPPAGRAPEGQTGASRDLIFFLIFCGHEKGKLQYECRNFRSFTFGVLHTAFTHPAPLGDERITCGRRNEAPWGCYQDVVQCQTVVFGHLVLA